MSAQTMVPMRADDKRYGDRHALGAETSSTRIETSVIVGRKKRATS